MENPHENLLRNLKSGRAKLTSPHMWTSGIFGGRRDHHNESVTRVIQKVSSCNQKCSHKPDHGAHARAGALPRHRVCGHQCPLDVGPPPASEILTMRQRFGQAPADRSMVRCSPRSGRALAACDIRAHAPKGPGSLSTSTLMKGCRRAWKPW